MRPCEEKTVHNCETSGYSTNTGLWKQWPGRKTNCQLLSRMVYV